MSDTIVINGKFMPFKKTNRVMRRLEANGIDVTGGSMPIALMINLAYEMVKEGALLAKIPFTMTLDEFETFDAESQESFIEAIVNNMNDNEKKLNTSSLESGGEVVTQTISSDEVEETIPKESVQDRMSKA